MSALTVTQLNNYACKVLDSDPVLNDIQVSGEISSFRKYPSGHLYFTLKDAESSVSCVMFRSYADKITFLPADGSQVVVSARASIYNRDGKFQLYVAKMIPDGIGDLFAAFELLKKKLLAEGLFDESHKKKIPLLPRKIGVATSSSGAVIRDIINVLSRRFPNFSLVLIPVKVQGECSSESIIKAIKDFNKRKEVDVIIVGRGGGSIEDLWCFNDEYLARAIYESEIPIISAVGHETDFTVCDFVADLRAPTPSAAAELAMPVKSELLDQINGYTQQLRKHLFHNLEYSKLRLLNAKNNSILASPSRLYLPQMDKLHQIIIDLNNSALSYIKDKKSEAALLNSRLDSLSPVKVINRGYGIIENLSIRKKVASIYDVSVGDRLKLIISDGSVESDVVSIIKDEVQKYE